MGWMVQRSNWGGDFLHAPRVAHGSTRLPKQQVLGYLQWGSGQGMALNTHPNLVPRLKKEWCCTYPPHLAIMVCCRVNLTFTILRRVKRFKSKNGPYWPS